MKQMLVLPLFLTVFFQARASVDAGTPVRRADRLWAAGDTVITLNLPTRPDDAPTGSELARRVAGLSLKDREVAIVHEILSGNVPSFGRFLRAIRLVRELGSQRYELTIFVACDYLAVGSDEDYLYTPMTPSTAQYLADRLGCILPTKRMVDIIYARADVKLRPQPIPPSDKMTTVPVFLQHTDSIRQQLAQIGIDRSQNPLVAGHKKDIIISKKIYTPDRSYPRVVIYGWHRSVNDPIQPVYNGHHANYADYSHGVRLISDLAILNGDTVRVSEILRSVELSFLLSDEGVIPKPYYPASDFFSSVTRPSRSSPSDFELYPNYPNPFRSGTTIRYSLRKRAHVTLAVYDSIGREVSVLADAYQRAGDYATRFRSEGLPVGIYYLRLSVGGIQQVRRIVLVK